MKKVILSVCFMVCVVFIASVASATMVDNRVSAGTITFSSVVATGNNVITFNSVTNHIKLVNLSTTKDCYVDFRCTDASGNTGFFTDDITGSSGKFLLPALGKVSPNSVELDFSTKNLGFCSSAVGDANDKISYIVTGDSGNL